MLNVSQKISKDGILTLTIDTKQTHGLSKSGKTTIVASSQGNQAVALPNGGGQVFIGVNCYRK